MNADWQRVWSVFEAASELRAEEREALIASELADAGAREQVRELLADMDSAEADPAPATEDSEDAGPRFDTGDRLGRFVLQERIGRGGMGEVFRSVDPDLGRTVAIKCIAPGRIGTRSSVAGFIEEARAASALNHPAIVTVHEILQAEDAVAIVMEYVDGLPVRGLCGRPQPIDQVIRWGQRIAEALAVSHAHGIVHRDIKPENLIVRPDGYVKLLDFGLAVRESAVTAPSGFPFEIPLGTVRYMSPEQTRGRQVTAATDIFSFGIVLYELTTGTHPFDPVTDGGVRFDSTIAVARKINRADVTAPSRLGVSAPADLERLILKMLAKDPAVRPAAPEVLEVLRLLEVAARRRRPAWVTAGLATVAAAASIAAVFAWRGGSEPAAPRAAVPFTSYSGSERDPCFSPDGSRIVFSWTGESGSMASLYMKGLTEQKPVRLTTGPGADYAPVWSPDGRWIAFLRHAADSENRPQLMVIPAGGGGARVVATVLSTAGHTSPLGWWPDSGSVVVRDSSENGIGLTRVSLTDGAKHALTSPPLDRHDGSPAASPDGQWFAFARRGDDDDHVCLARITGAGTSPAKCFEEGRGLIHKVGWEDASHLLVSARRAIVRLEMKGDRVASSSILIPGSYDDIAWDRGARRFAFGRKFSDINLWRWTSKGTERIATSSGEDSEPEFSPDGKRIAFRSTRSGSFEIWAANVDGSDAVALTSLGVHMGSPRWSPDGAWIVFDANSGAKIPGLPPSTHTSVCLVPASGGAVRRLTDDRMESSVPNWSSDGRWVYYTVEIGSRQEAWKVALEGGPAIRLNETPTFDGIATAEGEFYYTKPWTPNQGVWKRRGAGEESMVPGTTAVRPRYWQIRGRRLYYIDTGDTPALRVLDLRTGVTTRLAAIRQTLVNGPRGLAVSPDGSSVVYAAEDLTMSDILLMER